MTHRAPTPNRPLPDLLPTTACRRIALALLLVGLLTGAGPLAAQHFLAVGLTTDYQPSADFTAVQVDIVDLVGTLIRTNRAGVIPTDPVQDGIRVASFYDIANGTYEARIALLAVDGEELASSTTIFSISGARAIMVNLSRPQGSATKSGFLLTDEDLDGTFSPGDTVRYRIDFDGPTGSRLIDHLSSDLLLVENSVVTSSGTVVAGNDPGDTEVEVTDLHADSFVLYDAVITPTVTNQAQIVIPGVDGFAYIATDDPLTADPVDATELRISCSAGSLGSDLAACEQERDVLEGEVADLEESLVETTAALEQCDAELAATRNELSEVRGQLMDVIADPDGDGVPAVLDLCPDPPADPSDLVDERGCTLVQFCAAIEIPNPSQSQVCTGADWMNDEPIGNPRDCQATRARVCEAR